MSNVLIGIIGVVLFIGLALAGALILGSDFMSATSSSKAAAVVQGLQQVSSAYALYTLKTGNTIQSSQGDGLVSTLISTNKLKSAPLNPVNAANYAVGYDAIGQRGTTPMGTVIMTLGAGGTKTYRDICFTIEDQMGAANPSASVDTPVPFDTKVTTDKRVGCMLNSYSNTYVAYAVL